MKNVAFFNDFYHNSVIKVNPNNARIMAITTKRITAIIDMAKAFNQPQSKKCFTNASQITNRTKEEKIQKLKAPKRRKEKSNSKNSEKKISKIAPTIVPTMIIATASENFAFSLPTSALPANQRAGDRIMTFTIMCVANVNRLKLKASPAIYHV